MNNEIIKVGDYVEYVGRPNEKFLVKKYNGASFLFIELKDNVLMQFYEDGKNFPSDTSPIVKKTTPPKKKVLKEFDVELRRSGISYNYYFKLFNCEKLKDKTKAKLIIEVEE